MVDSERTVDGQLERQLQPPQCLTAAASAAGRPFGAQTSPLPPGHGVGPAAVCAWHRSRSETGCRRRRNRGMDRAAAAVARPRCSRTNSRSTAVGQTVGSAESRSATASASAEEEAGGGRQQGSRRMGGAAGRAEGRGGPGAAAAGRPPCSAPRPPAPAALRSSSVFTKCRESHAVRTVEPQRKAEKHNTLFISGWCQCISIEIGYSTRRRDGAAHAPSDRNSRCSNDCCRSMTCRCTFVSSTMAALQLQPSALWRLERKPLLDLGGVSSTRLKR